MSQPYTEPPPTVVYRVRINSNEWEEFKTPLKAARRVADNIFHDRDYSAQVEFQNAVDPALVRDNFKKRIVDRLREFGHKEGFFCEDDDETGGFHCRLEE
jgi:hypothetical protein